MCSFSCQNACWHDAKILTLSWHGQSVTKLIVKNVKARLFVQLSADKSADQVSGCLCIWENLSQITVLTAQWRTSQNTTSRWSSRKELGNNSSSVLMSSKLLRFGIWWFKSISAEGPTIRQNAAFYLSTSRFEGIRSFFVSVDNLVP